ncbi:hypothetical protein C1883_14210 [Pseudomonas protegens]|nr:hypothetical protein C1883_14210 [Pseudomonas protegens]
MPAKRPLSLALPGRTPSLASQLLHFPVAAAAGCERLGRHADAGDAAVLKAPRVCLRTAKQGPAVLCAASQARQRLQSPRGRL